MKILSEYQNVYENWYVKSCGKSNEEPVSFDIYFKRVPVKQVRQLKQMMASGQRP